MAKNSEEEHAIDLYRMPVWDPMTPIEEVVRAFDDLVRQGKVLYIGISDAPAWWVTPRFSADRTVREYTERHYPPAAASYQQRAADNASRGALPGKPTGIGRTLIGIAPERNTAHTNYTMIQNEKTQTRKK